MHDTDPMAAWPEGDRLDVAVPERILSKSRAWSHGRTESIRAERVGSEFGFSGRVHRLHLVVDDGDPTTLIVKFEDVDEIRREARFRRHNEQRMAGDIPASYAAAVDDARGRGLIVLKDVRPRPRATTSPAARQLGRCARSHRSHAFTRPHGSGPTTTP